jgi:hypothetical protein
VSPISVPVPDKTAGDVFTETMWDSYIRDNVNKLLDRGHRVLTVAQFSVLTPEDGDEVYLEVDATNGIMWHLRCVLGEPTYKWRFLGGPEMYSEVATAEGSSNTSYVALATAGPSIALPRSGDYMVEIDRATNDPVSNSAYMSYDIGGTGAVDADAVGGVGRGDGGAIRKRRKAGLGSVTLTAKYKVTGGGTVNFQNRYMAVTPVRVRHDA